MIDSYTTTSAFLDAYRAMCTRIDRLRRNSRWRSGRVRRFMRAMSGGVLMAQRKLKPVEDRDPYAAAVLNCFDKLATPTDDFYVSVKYQMEHERKRAIEKGIALDEYLGKREKDMALSAQNPNGSGILDRDYSEIDNSLLGSAKIRESHIVFSNAVVTPQGNQFYECNC